jgi:hypothetical protein
MSKYTAVLLPVAILIWLTVVPALRPALGARSTWAGVAVGCGIFSPVLVWNAMHAWAGFAKQGERAGAWQPGRALQFVAELLSGQAGLATPLIFLLCVAGIGAALCHAIAAREPGWTLLACLSVLPALLFLAHALGDRVQGNWPVIVYPAAIVAATGLAGDRWRRLFRPAVALGVAMTAVVYVQAIAAPLRLPGVFDPVLFRLEGWEALAMDVESVRRDQGASYIAADSYGAAAELAWSLSSAVAVVGVEARWSLFALPRAATLIDGQRGILLRSARRGDDIDRRPWRTIEEIGRVERRGGGMVVEAFHLYAVEGRSSDTAAVVLPHRGGF